MRTSLFTINICVFPTRHVTLNLVDTFSAERLPNPKRMFDLLHLEEDSRMQDLYGSGKLKYTSSQFSPNHKF